MKNSGTRQFHYPNKFMKIVGLLQFLKDMGNSFIYKAEDEH